MDFFYHWALGNLIEIFGMLTGLIYIWFSIKQNVLTWPFGILSSLLYIVVFFEAKFYAGMGLQFYYFFISIYGWWAWLHPSQNGNNKELQITRTTRKTWIELFVISSLLFSVMAAVLKEYTDSPIPYWDSLTTSLSIIATWMLARKKFEHWILWIFIDLVCIILYIWRGLYPTTLLFIVYAVMAVAGYVEWKKDLNKLECQQIKG
jgi:nicotinamide mononucleotide transporter